MNEVQPTFGEDAIMFETESTFSRQNYHQDLKIEQMITKCTLEGLDASGSKTKSRESALLR